jgi:pimeloyl-ACP methyl ester carboxylesterase
MPPEALQSTAMSQVTTASGITLEYDTHGSASDPALVLIMGFTAQMIDWPLGFVERLADLGRFVIRFDNRDCGLSTKFGDRPVDMNEILGALMNNDPSMLVGKVPYTLSDLAADVVGLLDALGIDQADIVGASMGGMIAQTMAIEHPLRVRTLTSIMSTTGEIEYGAADPEVMGALLTPAPTDRAGYIEHSGTAWLAWQSKRYGSAEANKERAAASYDRSFFPDGASRQMGAMVASGSRADGLRALDVPTLVIHGLDDRLIAPSGGERTAELVPGACLVLVEDMGHDVPEPLYDVIVGAIDDLITVSPSRSY